MRVYKHRKGKSPLKFPINWSTVDREVRFMCKCNESWSLYFEASITKLSLYCWGERESAGRAYCKVSACFFSNLGFYSILLDTVFTPAHLTMWSTKVRRTSDKLPQTSISAKLFFLTKGCFCQHGKSVCGYWASSITEKPLISATTQAPPPTPTYTRVDFMRTERH